MLVIVTILSLISELGKAEMEGFIVGGEKASILDYPHSAFLSVKCAKVNAVTEWICGSSIIHPKVLLTAAHCLDGCLKDSIISAAVGNEHRARGYKEVVGKFLIHMKYNTEHILNDIGMTKLLEPLVMSEKVKVAVLPKNRPKVETAFVAGWGLIDEIKRKESNMIKHTKQSVFPKNYCLKLLRNIPDGSICAGNPYSNDYASEGDSGSALVVPDYSNGSKITQIGLVSFKHPNISRSVAVYTDIPYFYEWIQSRMKKILK